ncbi:PPC domain-containing protein [Hyalangium versicolor]|uniref:PPC domain-containing protein n=1 Tax=Hyalangium versicolor TaxID=2861190 RepID=UPI00272BC646|nr:PPC domain-containing protein [Hyalangium versicolor]
MYAACFAFVMACGPGELTGTEVSEPAPKVDLAALQQPLAGDCTSTYSLTKDVAQTNLSSAQGTWSCIYKLAVPSGVAGLTFKSTGGTGDADLYVRYALAPDAASYDCRSMGTTNEEQCTGTYYVKLYGTSASTGAQLLVNMDRPYTAPVLARGQPFIDVSMAVGEQRRFEIDMPWGKNDVQFFTSGGTGYANLYVKFGQPPTPYNYDCTENGISTNTSCSMGWGKTGRYYVLVEAKHTPITGMRIGVNYTDYYN